MTRAGRNDKQRHKETKSDSRHLASVGIKQSLLGRGREEIAAPQMGTASTWGQTTVAQHKSRAIAARSPDFSSEVKDLAFR